mmetsp:Transcript_22304/g.33329  ORF Transcript_22304/g.33329 Transcript_22304/m.33329 type:complete len:245 (-) Transcript_22304:289-1023(-)
MKASPSSRSWVWSGIRRNCLHFLRGYLPFFLIASASFLTSCNIFCAYTGSLFSIFTHAILNNRSSSKTSFKLFLKSLDIIAMCLLLTCSRRALESSCNLDSHFVPSSAHFLKKSMLTPRYSRICIVRRESLPSLGRLSQLQTSTVSYKSSKSDSFRCMPIFSHSSEKDRKLLIGKLTFLWEYRHKTLIPSPNLSSKTHMPLKPPMRPWNDVYGQTSSSNDSSSLLSWQSPPLFSFHWTYSLSLA